MPIALCIGGPVSAQIRKFMSFPSRATVHSRVMNPPLLAIVDFSQDRLRSRLAAVRADETNLQRTSTTALRHPPSKSIMIRFVGLLRILAKWGFRKGRRMIEVTEEALWAVLSDGGQGLRAPRIHLQGLDKEPEGFAFDPPRQKCRNSTARSIASARSREQARRPGPLPARGS